MKGRKLLMIPGPIEFEPEVLQAMGEARYYVWTRSYDLRPLFSHVGVPVLIMGGDRDPFFGLEHPVAAYEGIKGSELCIIPGGGHFVNEQSPALFNGFVMDFLARRCAAPAGKTP